MRLELDQEMIGFLNGILRRPDTLKMSLIGMPNFPHYTPKDEVGRRQMHTLKDWLEKRVLTKNEKGDFEFEAKTVGLKQAYVERLKEVLKHYERFGGLAICVEPYTKLMAMLNGEDYKADDAWEDIDE